MKTLFDEPQARASDPPTSKAAARSAKQHADTIRRAIQWAFSDIAGNRKALTDEELIAVVLLICPYASDSGIRTRRSELVKAGLVVDSGERGKTKSGRESIKWRAT